MSVNGQIAANFLDSAQAYGRSLYLRLFAGPAGTTLNPDGTLPAGVVEIIGHGYTPLLVPQASWAPAVAGTALAPAYKEVPAVAQPDVAFTASGGQWSGISCYAWTTTNGVITPTTFVSSECFVDPGTGDPVITDVPDGQTLKWTPAKRLRETMGRTPPGVNPT